MGMSTNKQTEYTVEQTANWRVLRKCCTSELMSSESILLGREKRKMHFSSRLSLRIILPYTLSGKPLSEETILTDKTFMEFKYARSFICLSVYLMGSTGAAEAKAE
jgi:hypothetical protein